MTAKRQRGAKVHEPAGNTPRSARAGSSARPSRIGAKERVWQRRADALALRIPKAALHPGALREIQRAAAAGERVAIACSGGADSVALVLTLWTHVPELRGRWLILHFDHGLRGRASSGDARFAAALARGLGETCVDGRWSQRGQAKDARGRVSEADARQARFSFFAHAMQAAGARVLALGHQADDVVETMLMRLVRGSATSGLAAPRPVHRRADGSVRVRPLLELDASALRTALRDADIPWREDATNAADTFTRNRLRRSVLPALRAAVRHDVAKGFLAAREALEEDDDALEQLLSDLISKQGLGALRHRPRALARRAVQAWLQANGLGDSLSRPAAAVLIDAVAAGRIIRQSAGSGRFVIFDGRMLSLEASTAVVDPPGRDGCWLELESEGHASSAGNIEVRRVPVTAPLRRKIMAGKVESATTAFIATDVRRFFIRRREAGDRYRPLGAPGRIRLQDAFVNRKIPRELRDRLPVVTDESGAILWVPGLPPAAELAVQTGTKVVVQLTYQVPKAIVSPSSDLPTLSQDHVRA